MSLGCILRHCPVHRQQAQKVENNVGVGELGQVLAGLWIRLVLGGVAWAKAGLSSKRASFERSRRVLDYKSDYINLEWRREIKFIEICWSVKISV